MSKLKIGVLGSTRGTVLQGLLDEINNNGLEAEVKIVISNNADSYILKRAEQNNIKSVFLDPTKFSKEDYDARISEYLVSEGIELVALIGYMRLLTAGFVSHWDKRAINIHPSLLPDYAGKLGSYIYKEVLATKKKVTGCTVHYINNQLDMGPIILQKQCQVADNDTEESLQKKVQGLEKEALLEVIRNEFIENKNFRREIV